MNSLRLKKRIVKKRRFSRAYKSIQNTGNHVVAALLFTLEHAVTQPRFVVFLCVMCVTN